MKSTMRNSVVCLMTLLLSIVFAASVNASAGETKVEIVNACSGSLSNITIEYKLNGENKATTFSLARAAKRSIIADRGTRVFAKYGNNKVKSVNANGKFTRLALTD